MKLACALFALVAAQDDSGASTPAASDNSYGYEAPQETYAAPQETYAAPQETYAAEPAPVAYSAPAVAFVARAPKVCVVCDAQAPCWNGATCSPKTFAAASYAAPVESYGAQAESYGAQAESYGAQAESYGAQQESGYRRLAGYGEEAAYEPAGYAAPAMSGSCPCGSIDTKFYRVHNRIVLWVTFGLLFVPFLYFFCMSFSKQQDEDQNFNSVRSTASIVCAIASLAYLTMALGYGFVTKCNGRDFYYARYIDWALTTPIMLYEIAKLSDRDDVTTWFLVLMDVFMIIAGLIGELIEGSERWAFFGFSMLAFLPILYFVCIMYSIVSDKGGCGTNGLGLGQNKKRGVTPDKTREDVVRRIAGITLLTWIGYPIIWILASVHGPTTSCGFAAGAPAAGYRALQAAGVTQAGVISVQGETYAYSVLDIIAKSLMGFALCCVKYDNTPGSTTGVRAVTEQSLYYNIHNPSFHENFPLKWEK